MKTFKEWWNSPLKKSDPSLLSHRECAEQAWNYAYEMQEDRISNLKVGVMELEEKLEIAEKDIRYLKKRLGDANEQITSIAKDNGKLRTEIASYQEPTEERAVNYIATVSEVCEDEAEAFYMGTLDDIMEW